MFFGSYWDACLYSTVLVDRLITFIQLWWRFQNQTSNQSENNNYTKKISPSSSPSLHNNNENYFHKITLIIIIIIKNVSRNFLGNLNFFEFQFFSAINFGNFSAIFSPKKKFPVLFLHVCSKRRRRRKRNFKFPRSEKQNNEAKTKQKQKHPRKNQI